MNNLNNVSLWFAKDDNGKITTIDKISKEYRGKYYCPLCGSEVIPKALESDCVAPHFAHIDKDKCSGEGVIHWWVKNELIKVNDVIRIITDTEKQVLCKDICFEKSYETPHGTYKPDITIKTQSGEIIFIEVNFTNKKKIEEYLPKWKSLGNTVIEFNIKNVYNEENNKIEITNTFKALYYQGKEFSIDKGSKDYKSYRSSIKDKLDEDLVDKLNEIYWFVDDIYKYNSNINNDLNVITSSFITLANNRENHKILENLYRNGRCQNVVKTILEKRDSLSDIIVDKMKNNINYNELDIKCTKNGNQRLIYDRIENNKISFSYKINLKDIESWSYIKEAILNYGFERLIRQFTNNNYAYRLYEDSIMIYDNLIIDDVIYSELSSDNIPVCIYNKEDIENTYLNLAKNKDYLISINTSGDIIKILEEDIIDLFAKVPSIIGNILENNKDYFFEESKFIKEYLNNNARESLIVKMVNLLDYNKYVYEENNFLYLKTKKYLGDLISNLEFDKFLEFESECTNDGFIYLDELIDEHIDTIFNEILNNVIDNKMFDNYDLYKDIIDGCEQETEDLLIETVKSEISNNKSKYIRNFKGVEFINNNYQDYYEILCESEDVKLLFKKHNKMYILHEKIITILQISGIDSHIGIGLNSSDGSLEYEFDKYTLSIKDNVLKINDVRICYLNEDLDDIVEKVKFSISIINPNASVYASDNVISIYSKLKRIYENYTHTKFKVTIVDNVIYIKHNYKLICEVAIDDNSNIENIIELSSNSVRNHLYSGKEN